MAQLKNFNFISFNASTFKSFDEELASQTLISSTQSQQLLFKSLSSIYFSLTSNAQKIFLIIIQKQLDLCTSSNKFSGISFKDLYQYCREAFLVSSDLALRTLLVELVDHSILKHQRLNDGSENLHVPVEKNDITEFLKENDINLKNILD